MDVPIRCICPLRDGEVRHPDGDTITLSDRPSFREATAMRNGVAIVASEKSDEGTELGFDESLATLTESYLVHGVKSWTLQHDAEDKKGRPLEQPIPVNRRTIEEILLPEFDVAWDVGEVADSLYSKLVMLPLIVRGSRPSPGTPTGRSMSPTTKSSTKPPKRSRRSSTSTSLTVVTEATSGSLDGDSNLSPSSTSAA